MNVCKIVKRAALWMAMVMFVVAPVIAVDSYAAEDVEVVIDNVRAKLEDAAVVQLVTQKLIRCIPSVRSDLYGSMVKVGDIFDHGFNPTNISVGPWLEEQIQGEISDGMIWCKDELDGQNILHLFAKKMAPVIGEVGVPGVVCRYDDPGRGGLLGVFKSNGAWVNPSYEYAPDDVDCDVFNYSVRYGVKPPENGGGEAYIEELYNKYRNEVNEYLVPFGDRNTYEQTNGYFLHLKDFEVDCGSGVVDDSHTHFSVPLKTVDDNGDIIERYIAPKEGKTVDSVIGHSFVGDGARSCAATLDTINAYVEHFRNAMIYAIRDACKASLEEYLLAIEVEMTTIVGDTTLTPASKDSAQRVLDEIAGIKVSGNYTKTYGDRGLVCIDDEDIEGLPDVIQEQYQDPAPDPGDGGGTPGSVTASCYDGSGALGWILCPVLDGLGQAAEGMYEGLVEPFLRVDARLFDVGGSGDDVAGDNTFAAWQIFQGLANIVFIVLLLVVIFSQLTGVGIDSYGIRKILPKLIVAAILINLSYIICQLLVDVSNVMGFGARGMLSGIADGVGEISLKAPGMAQNLSVAGGYSAFGVIVGAVAVGAVVASGFAVLLPVLLAVLSAVIGIMFTFVLLGVRQAGVVLLVVISPLAFVCYMLPNTKSLFDRWRKLFQALLLFFPLCGLLMGAGDLSSKILLSTNSENIYMILIAMLLNIVPLFFLPTLLKGAFAAMGNIGAKISGLGKMASGGLTNRIRNSEGYKERQIAGRAAGASRMGKIAKSKFGQTRAGRLLFNRDGQVRARARAMAAQDKVTDANVSARKILAESRDAKTLTEGALENNIIDMLEAGNADGAAAEVAVAMDRLGASKGTTVLRYAMERAQAGGKLKAGGDVERDFMRMVNKSHGATISKKDYALGMSLSTGGHDKNGNHQTVQAAVGGLTAGDLKPEEAATLSKGSLARAFNSGAVDQVMARRVLEDDALRQKLDSTALAQWETIASGGAVFTATHTNLGGQRVDDSISGTNTYVDPVVAARNAQVAAQQQMATDQSAMRAAQQAHFTATQTHQSDVFMVQQQLVHSQHEEAARKQGPATHGPAKGLYEDPTGFNATNPLVGNVAINAKGEKWDRTRGKYL